MGSALGPIASIASIGGTGYSIYQQERARKEAQEEAERQRKMDIMRTIVSIAGGQGVPGMSPSVSVPQVDYGGAISNVGNIATDYAKTTDDAEYKKEYLAMMKKYYASQAMKNAGYGYDPTLYGQMEGGQIDPFAEIRP